MKSMMNKLLLLMLFLLSGVSYSKQLSSGSFIELSKYGNNIKCESLDNSNYYECILKYSGSESRRKLMINNYYCLYFDVSIEEKNILRIGCSAPDYISNYYFYRKEKRDWFLFKYQYLHGPKEPDDTGEEFIVESNYLRSLKRNIFNDFKGELILYGVINSKTFLYKDINKKLPMYLIKGDKVLILDTKVDSENRKWYRVYYQGKKDIDAWIEASFVEIKG